MLIDDLIGELGYAGSPNFVHGAGLGQAADYAHIFRRAQERMNLRGVYVLQQPATKESYRKALVPVVYVCEAKDESSAQQFPRLAWNQNAAPFLIVATVSYQALPKFQLQARRRWRPWEAPAQEHPRCGDCT